jgi:hypothetical protein
VLFICAEIAVLNFVGFGVGFPLLFAPVVVLIVGTILFPLWKRREKDEAAYREGPDPSIPPDSLPDYRRPWW